MSKPGNTPLSIALKVFFGLLTIALFGGLFIDMVAATNPAWAVAAHRFGEEVSLRYIKVLNTFEGY